MCQGTGRAADIIAYAATCMAECEKNTGECRLNEKAQHEVFYALDVLSLRHFFQLADMLAAAYGKDGKLIHQYTVEERIKRIECCCKEENLIRIFDINHSEDFDLAILTAILKCKRLLQQIGDFLQISDRQRLAAIGSVTPGAEVGSC